MDEIDPVTQECAAGLLQQKLAAAADVRQRLSLFLQLVDELQKSDVSRAIEVCQQAVTLARQPGCEDGGGYTAELADCLFHLAMLYARSGSYLKAISTISETLPIIEEGDNRFLLARAYNVAGVAFESLGNYSDAIDYLMKALKIFQELGDRSWEAGVLNNIGHLYWQNNNLTWSLMYLSLGLHLAEEQLNKSMQGDICETLCAVYLDNRECDTALEYGLRALGLYREINNHHAEAEVLNSIGDVYQAQDQTEKALESYRQALSLSRETGHNHEEVESLLRLGRALTCAGSDEEALVYLIPALENARRLETRHNIYECHSALTQYYKVCADYQKALEHSELLFTEYRQLHSEEQNQRIQSLVAKHQLETMQKDAEIYRLKNAALQNEINLQKKAHDNLQQLAIRDHLTGLYNRYYFYDLTLNNYTQWVSSGTPLSVIMVDADRFKNVNDEFGHSAGDEVLKKLAETLLSGLRRNDVIARYGGDEFVILLQGADNAHAVEVAERLRKTASQHQYQADGQKITVTCSVGIAHYETGSGLSLEDLIKQADRAMYDAKQNGGNCVRVFSNG